MHLPQVFAFAAALPLISATAVLQCPQDKCFKGERILLCGDHVPWLTIVRHQERQEWAPGLLEQHAADCHSSRYDSHSDHSDSQEYHIDLMGDPSYGYHVSKSSSRLEKTLSDVSTQDHPSIFRNRNRHDDRDTNDYHIDH